MTQPLIPTESLKFTEARPILSELLNRVFRRETRIRLFKGSVPVAAIVSIRDLERLEKLDCERAEQFEVFHQIGERFTNLSPEEIEEQVAQAIADARARKLTTAKA